MCIFIIHVWHDFLFTCTLHVYSEWTCTVTKQLGILAYWVLMRAKPARNCCLAFSWFALHTLFSCTIFHCWVRVTVQLVSLLLRFRTDWNQWGRKDRTTRGWRLCGQLQMGQGSWHQLKDQVNILCICFHMCVCITYVQCTVSEFISYSLLGLHKHTPVPVPVLNVQVHKLLFQYIHRVWVSFLLRCPHSRGTD